MSDNELRDTVKEVLRAITDQGRSPYHHQKVMVKHRQEWPTLWRALDRLTVAAHNDGGGV